MVLTSDPEAIDEMARLEVVALVVVELPEIFRSPVNVDEALVKMKFEVVADTPAEG